MRNFQYTCETRKQSFISDFSICMIVPLTYNAMVHKLKSMLFDQLTLLSNNLVVISYLSGIY